MKPILIKNANVVNEGEIYLADVLIVGGKIKSIFKDGDIGRNQSETGTQIINASGKFLLPGVIDDQVHFREPGLTYKADIYSESKAAVAGGITSYMEMPNTLPPVLSQELLEEKYRIAEKKSLINYSFYMGASNTNIDELLKTNPENVCGIKIFMGSSTGNMLVDDPKALESIFSQCKIPITVHCEDETTVSANIAKYRNKFGEHIPIEHHPVIRNEEACYKSSSLAVTLAKKHNTRLHILHVSTAKEIGLFENDKPLQEKMITSEACIHHLWFDSRDYKQKGALIKWNPAIKTPDDRRALLNAVINDNIDIIATDHAPHTIKEKGNPYLKAPAGGPLVQHALVAMLELYHRKKISLEKIAEKMCHAPAECFRIKKRGFIKPGYWADLVIVDLNAPWIVDETNIISKCRWSPFQGQIFTSRVIHTLVNGNLIYSNGIFYESEKGQRLLFER